VDKQPAPQPEVEDLQGSVQQAQEAILGILNSEENAESEEAEPQEEAVSEEEPEEEPEGEEPEEEFEEESEEGEEDEGDVEELLYAVKVDGEESEVTLDELLNGYSRQSSFTRKTQDLAEQRKEFDNAQQHMAAEYQQIQAERQQYEATLNSILENSNLDKFANVDWETLKMTDPLEYMTKRQEQQDGKEKVRELQAQRDQAVANAQVENDRLFQQAKAENAKFLVEAIPELQDPEEQPKLISELRVFGLEQGFSEEELNGLIDWRSIVVLDKARRYDEIQNADLKTKKVKNKPRVVRSGSSATRSEGSKKTRTAKMKRLQRTGHVDDAVTLLEDMMNS
tara:strand:- start:368 stop:1384 length:1017 start_codon:yes stop_codon:yes gene_type:complete